MKPEDKARQRIDHILAQAGWLVQDYGARNIAAATGVAIREFPLTTGFADYLLYADEGARGRGGQEGRLHTHRRRDAIGQVSRRVAEGFAVPPPAAAVQLRDDGEATRFTNHLDPNPR